MVHYCVFSLFSCFIFTSVVSASAPPIIWQKSLGGFSYALASDFYPHGQVAEQYGVLRTGPPIPGISERAIFIIDKEGKVAFSHVYELSELPENEELFQALRKL